MPELPEVETFRRYFEASSLHKKVIQIDAKPKTEKLFKVSTEQFRECVLNHQFISTKRIGKYLFAKLTNGLFVVFHFGMTGDFSYYRDPADEPKRAKIIFSFAGGDKLSYNSRRKFGWVDITQDVISFQKEKKLGTDALNISFEDFLRLFQNRKSPIKSKLMDQKLIAGVGNWVADEILYHSKIHPSSICAKLSKDAYETIYEQMQKILKIAVEVEANIDRMPDYFIFRYRDKKGKDPATGKPFKIIDVGGRTTYLSSASQTLYD